MSNFAVPFHIEERLPDRTLPVPTRSVAATLPTDGPAWERLAVLYEQVAEAVRDDGDTVLVTGDCTTSLGVLAGLQRRRLDPAVVWFDAHGDLNTPETTPSGYLGGMPFAMALGHGDPTVADRLGLRTVPPERAVLVDGRDLDPGERDLIAATGLRHVPVGEVAASIPDGPLYLHVDLDVLDPRDLPGLRYPAPGGPAEADVLAALTAVVATGRVAAACVALTSFPEAGGTHDPRTDRVLESVLAVLAD